jgi:hypothetical protein
MHSAECWGIQILIIRYFNSFGFFWDTLHVYYKYWLIKKLKYLCKAHDFLLLSLGNLKQLLKQFLYAYNLLMSSFYTLVGLAECWGIQILTIIRYFNSFGFFWDTPYKPGSHWSAMFYDPLRSVSNEEENAQKIYASMTTDNGHRRCLRSMWTRL